MARSKLLDAAASGVARRAKEMLARGPASDALGVAVSHAQAGKQRLEAGATELFATLGLISQADLERVGQRVGRLRKRLQALLDELES